MAQPLPIFTDIPAALEEAEFLANRSGQAHSLVAKEDAMVVVRTTPYTYPRALETIKPAPREAITP
jgi:hypothetical protein